MPKGGRLGDVEEKAKSNLPSEVEEIKMKMAKMGQQNLQMGENLKQMQIQMQESIALMQNQIEALMKAILPKNGPSEQPGACAIPIMQESTRSQIGLDNGGSPSLVDRVRRNRGSGHSFAPPSTCLGMHELPVLATTNP